PEGQGFEPGRAVTLRPGRDVTLIAIGSMVSRALQAAEALSARGVEARVVNAASVKPLDHATVLAAARETRGIVTVEEATVQGGLGSAVAELVSQQQPVRMRIMGVTGFAPTGNAAFLLEHFGLTAEGIAERALELLREA
ncbi:MAG TPA: transketolase C-terminal domain-containing protein, partial [Ideonella sp.]|nr:transketolase C-terminal domain-containing protein [Ideonella sp.]